MEIILVRHGETLANRNGIYSGWSDYELTDTGQKQTVNTSKKLANYEFDIIYSSPLRRTVMLAEQIKKSSNKEIALDERIKEFNFGCFDGKTFREINNEYPGECDMWEKDCINFKIPNGENLKDLYKRVKDFYESINKFKSVLVVTHSGVIQASIIYLLNIGMENFWKFKIPLGSIVEIEYAEGFGILKQIRVL